MVGAQFESVGTDSSADLNTILNMSGISAVGFDDMYDTGAEIMVLNGTTYKHYFYINDAFDGNDEPVEGNVWADGDGYIITEDDVLALGDGFWFKVPAASCAQGATVTVAGQVSAVSVISKEFNGSSDGYYTIISNPFPVDTDLSSVETSGIAAVSFDDMYDIGSEILALNGTTYKHYFYINDAFDSNDEPVEGNVWADGDGYIVTNADSIPAGNAFWMRGRQNGALVFSISK